MYGPEPKPALPPEQRDRARSLRRRSSMPERFLWKRLRNRACHGLKFRRQHAIDPYVADFYCDEARLIVELDSDHHAGQGRRDAARDDWMARHGIATIRVSASDLMKSEDAVVGRIAAAARARIAHLRGPGPT